MGRLKFFVIYVWIEFIIFPNWFVSGDIAPSTMVLPDDSIHGTRRHHFEVHDMSDVFGGKWKAVHIPDEQISSMLETAHRRNGSGYSLDIEHENPEKGTDVESIKVPVKIHGRVHAFEHDALLNNSKNSSRSIGNLIVAMENEVRGKETRPLHNAGHKVLNLREKTKEIQEEPTTREIAARNPRRPSVVVAKIPDDDESDEELPLREMHDPIVASLRKTPPKDGGGAMRSDIQERVRSRYSANFARKTLGEQTSGSWLNKIIAQVRLPSVPALLTKTLTKTREGVMRSKVLPKVASPSDTQSTTTVPQATPGHPTGGSSVSEKVSNNKEHISEKTKNVDVLEKIKSLLLKPHSKSEDAPMVKTVDKAAVTPLVLKTAGKSEGKPLAVHPEKDVSSHRNSDGLFLPKPGSQQDAFSNHAAALNRISSAKKEALLLGIIKALLSRGRSKLGPNAMNINAMPHYDKQAVLQGIQSLQMQKTFGNAQKNGAAAGIDTGDPGSVKGLEEFYEKQREQQVRQELARANEESEEARRASLQEGSMLSNYDRFSNPEAQNNFNNMNPEHSETINGQVISLMGPQQLTMVADNPTATK